MAGFVPLREDAAPRNRSTEALESHLGKELDILLVAVVEVDPFVVRVVEAIHHTVGDLALFVLAADGHHVGDI